MGRGLWNAILDAGKELGIEPYGTEALHVLRAEKGFITDKRGIRILRAFSSPT